MHTAALPALYLASLALARVILATAHGVPCDALEPARALLRASVRSHGVDAPAAVLAAMHSASMHLGASTLEHLGALAGDVTDCGNDATCAALALTLAACAGALCAALEQHTAGHLERASLALTRYAEALEQLAPHLGADLDAGAREGAGEARAHAARLASVARLPGSFNGGRVDAP